MRKLRILVALLPCLLLVGAAASAQTTSPVSLVSAGEYDAARAAALESSNPALDSELIEALIDRREGRNAAAIARLRGILRAAPGLVPVRRLLANTLVADGQYEAAEFHFRRLLEDDPDNRAVYNRAIRTISGLKPFGFTASLAFVPSTNINRGTLNEIFSTDFGDFIIDDESLGASGVGLALGAGAFRRFELENGRRLQFDARAAAILYDRPEFNQHSFTLRATLSGADDGQAWSIAPEYKRAYVEGALYYNLYALTLSRALQINDDTALRVRGLAEYRDYIEDTFLTGPRYEIETTLRRRLDPRTALEWSVAYKLGETKAERFQYNGIEVGARLDRVFASGLNLRVGLAHEWRPYRGDFTGVTFPRNDNITTLEASAFNDSWTLQGTTPTVSCRVAFAQSNIAFYDYDVQECSIGFTRAF